jgi:hypothetical protein
MVGALKKDIYKQNRLNHNRAEANSKDANTLLKFVDELITSE